MQKFDYENASVDDILEDIVNIHYLNNVDATKKIVKIERDPWVKYRPVTWTFHYEDGTVNYLTCTDNDWSDDLLTLVDKITFDRKYGMEIQHRGHVLKIGMRHMEKYPCIIYHFAYWVEYNGN